MINRLVVSNLRHRPIRTGLSILAIAMEVTMMLLIVGLADGLLEESQSRSRSIGADILIRPSSSSAAMTLSTADIPAKLAAFLPENHEEIEMAMGTTVNTQGDLNTITGVDWDTFTRMCDGIHFFSGEPPKGPYDVVVDEVYARYKKVEVGDTLSLLNSDFRVTGVVETGKLSRIFIPLRTMQELMGWDGQFSQLFVKLRDPADTQRMVKEISAQIPSYPVFAMEEFLSLVATDIRKWTSQFVYAIVAIAAVIGFLVVLLSMYTSVLERTREIGILKSLGATNSFVVTVLMREVAVLCLVGIVAGIAAGYGIRESLRTAIPLLTILITGNWIVVSALLAVAGAMLGALYPATRAARQDQIEALSYD
jgi:putative ABC transport system permease protein